MASELRATPNYLGKSILASLFTLGFLLFFLDYQELPEVWWRRILFIPLLPLIFETLIFIPPILATVWFIKGLKIARRKPSFRWFLVLLALIAWLYGPLALIYELPLFYPAVCGLPAYADSQFCTTFLP